MWVTSTRPAPGLEEFKVDEDGSKPASWMADAKTGRIIWSTPADGDNGRGVSGGPQALQHQLPVLVGR